MHETYSTLQRPGRNSGFSAPHRNIPGLIPLPLPEGTSYTSSPRSSGGSYGEEKRAAGSRTSSRSLPRSPRKGRERRSRSTSSRSKTPPSPRGKGAWGNWSGRDEVSWVAEGGIRVRYASKLISGVSYRALDGSMVHYLVDEGRLCLERQDVAKVVVAELWFRHGVPIATPPLPAQERIVSRRLAELATRMKVYRDSDGARATDPDGHQHHANPPPPPPPISPRASPREWDRPWRSHSKPPSPRPLRTVGGGYLDAYRERIGGRHREAENGERGEKGKRVEGVPVGGGYTAPPPPPRYEAPPSPSLPFCPQCGQKLGGATPFCPQTGTRH